MLYNDVHILAQVNEVYGLLCYVLFKGKHISRNTTSSYVMKWQHYVAYTLNSSCAWHSISHDWVSRAQDLVSCAHYLVSCVHYLVSCVHYLVSCAHYLVSCAHYLVYCAHYLVSCAHDTK